MSRVAKRPVKVPSGVEVKLDGQDVKVKGPKGELAWTVHDWVAVEQADGELRVQAQLDDRRAVALAGTTRALLNNMVTGVSQGFERKLELRGVGYRAQVQGKNLNLTLGFSHPVDYPVPEGITIEAPSQTEIVVKGADKQQVGEVAAQIRAFRPPEPYKGKGVRYADERVVLKEAKKK
ncbi:50S ribosomal protein L6 [Alkalilimnicola ehrlichii MLHE-1]|uniref:Large ribosomal subunit protein uL6 n=1 Tax=Alkalilimnicola ehrlichii (strain ATCC BAA-1101 / DSM 17681 / MLHE-1) TaxID=187272 RepID=RL6_ALKEH|nr:50S ribosomal protein L6 [Alkalilimnicola ehrlichii]Q0ABG0.1 RecName: Full=Large ribosomal subunit protein uL6; AltName: Full=50S ribosomal protein L6 [Alkalilimnicola ehrlichii MLHE-1]ABI55827.1 LSU ribosomal protein L6P [Alkalilimnicola ehrlichii MLHE-1]